MPANRGHHDKHRVMFCGTDVIFMKTSDVNGPPLPSTEPSVMCTHQNTPENRKHPTEIRIIDV